MTVPSTAARVVPPGNRSNFFFSPKGTHATSLVLSAGGEVLVESRRLDSPASPWRQARTSRPVGRRRQAVPCDDGRILLLRNGNDEHELSVLDTTAGERTVGVIAGNSARLLGSPCGPTLGYVIGARADGTSAITRVQSDRPLETIGIVPGRIGTADWLDRSRPILGYTQLDGDRSRPVAVDLGAAELRTVATGRSERTHLLLAGSSTALYADGEPGAMRLGWGVLHDHLPVRFPKRLNEIDGTVLPLAMSQDGRRVALRVTTGARSRLLIYRPRTDVLTEVDLPIAGTIAGTGIWTTSALWFPYSAPSVPGELAAVTFSGRDAHFHAPDQLPGPAFDTRLEQFDGPAGPIEAVVYGDWTTSDRVLLALHGGPESAWALDYQPLLTYLARAGIAVVAPNQRGSVGYGTDHQRAIRGDWGGPDLADVLHLAGHLAARHGGRLLLYGASYGAYLALLAAAAQPELWRRCVAVAPFLSGERLHAQAAPPVRRLIARLGGRAHHDGGRDLAVIHDRLRTPLLIVHGSDDEVIPVGQSRALHHLLRQNGEPAELVYLEIDGAGHDPYAGPATSDLYASTLAFLR
jgi:dipeptidyl aminopeptidase/acylaminoacyl peptidase